MVAYFFFNYLYRNMAIVIVLDLSLPNELLNTVETLLPQVRSELSISAGGRGFSLA